MCYGVLCHHLFYFNFLGIPILFFSFHSQKLFKEYFEEVGVKSKRKWNRIEEEYLEKVKEKEYWRLRQDH